MRDCHIENAHTLLGIGSEISGGVRNIRLQDCTGGDIHRVIFIKTNRRRGATIEDIHVDGVTVGKSKVAVFAIETDVLYEWAKFPTYEERLTRIGNVEVRNVYCSETGRRIKIEGDKDLPVDGIRVSNVVAGKAKDPDKVVNAVNVEIR